MGDWKKKKKKERQLPGSGLLILDIGEGAEKANLTSQRTRYTKIKAGRPPWLAALNRCAVPVVLVVLDHAPRSPLPCRYRQPRNEVLGSRDRGPASHQHVALSRNCC